MLHLSPITPENFWDIIDLTVSPDQEALVTSNAVSIAQAYVQPECHPLAIYAEKTPVGFLMYCIDRDDGEYWLYRLMIDAAHQNQGYGRQAMDQLLAHIQADPDHHRIFLGVHRDAAAVRLYEALGFSWTGQVFGAEHIMVLSY